MASRQVLKLCEKIEKDCGLVCKPDTFSVVRDGFNVWSMEVDLDKSMGFFSEFALNNMGNYVTCASGYYIKDLLKYDKYKKSTDIDSNEVTIYPKGEKHDYTPMKLSKGVYFYRGYTISNCGYHAPDRCVWWEAVNMDTGCADFHAHTKKRIIEMIDNEKQKGETSKK